MRFIKKFLFPLLAGFIGAEAATSLSLYLFVNRFMLAPEGTKDIFENDALSLTCMMILSAYLTYVVMLLCRKLNGRMLGDPEEEKSGRYFALYVVGALLVAAYGILLAMGHEGNLAATLILISYVIIFNSGVMTLFALLIRFVKWLIKRMGKDGSFLYKLKWQLPLSLLWFVGVLSGMFML